MQKTWPLAVLIAALPACLSNGSARATEAAPPAAAGFRAEGHSLSRFQRASLSGTGVDAESPTGENQAYSRADIGLLAHPNPRARGALLLRVHQDWNRYYEEGPNPLLIRRLDFTGSLAGGRWSFALGDFQALWSPLTLSVPEPEVLLEPEIFADRRREAMGEWFLGGHSLPLQGLRIAHAPDSAARFALSAEALGARLRRADPDGGLAWRFRTDDVDRWMGGAIASLHLFRAAEAGLSGLRAFDPVTAARARGGNAPLYETNEVIAPRAAFDAAPFLAGSPWSLRLEAEQAWSRYRSRQDSATPAGPVLRSRESLSGRALLAALRAGYGRDEDRFSLGLELAYLQVDPGYVNDLAQSPAFLGRRILNSKNPVAGSFQGYSTLDALYHHAYDIRPVTHVNSLEGWGAGSARPYNGTNNWLRTASCKNSYASSVTTRSERKTLAGALDPRVQLLFPYGRATPDRKGTEGTLKGTGWGGAARGTAVFARLTEGEADASRAGSAPAAYSRDGAGLALDLGAWWLRVPASLSGSWLRDTRDTLQVTWLNAGMTVRLGARWKASAGWQRLANTASGTQAAAEQGQWALGLEAAWTPGLTVSAEAGRMTLQEAGGAADIAQAVLSMGIRIGF